MYKIQVKNMPRVGHSRRRSPRLPTLVLDFCFMIDRAGPRANHKTIGETVTQPIKTRQTKQTKQKWVDDFTVLPSVDLKQNLVPELDPVQPVPWRGRHHQILPDENNPLKYEIYSIVKYSEEHKMLLNPIKTKAMVFNTLRNYDCIPQISIKSGENIEIVEHHKILGKIVRSDMRTISNTEAICKKGYNKMWILRRLKSLDCSTPELLVVLREQIVSIAK